MKHDYLRKGEETVQRMRESAGVVIDPEKIRKTVEHALEALQKQAEVLRDVKYDKEFRCPHCDRTLRDEPAPRDVSQTAAYTARVIDDVYRLSEFAQGRADSRPDVGVGDLLQFISDEQLQTLMSWVAEAKARTTMVAGDPMKLQ